MNVINTVGTAPWRTALELGSLQAWRALQRWWAGRCAARAERDARRAEQELAALNARTLRDIGASPRLQARAEAQHAMQRDERAALRLGIASGAWRHW